MSAVLTGRWRRPEELTHPTGEKVIATLPCNLEDLWHRYNGQDKIQVSSRQTWECFIKVLYNTYQKDTRLPPRGLSVQFAYLFDIWTETGLPIAANECLDMVSHDRVRSSLPELAITSTLQYTT